MKRRRTKQETIKSLTATLETTITSIEGHADQLERMAKMVHAIFGPTRFTNNLSALSGALRLHAQHARIRMKGA